MTKEENEVKNTKEKKFLREYSEIFSILGINADNIKHEWNKEGDNIKEYNLFEDHPTPILTPNTHPLNC